MFNTVENNVQNNVQLDKNVPDVMEGYLSEDGYVVLNEEEFYRSYIDNRSRLIKQIFAYIPLNTHLCKLLREDIEINDPDYRFLTKPYEPIDASGSEWLLRAKISLMNQYLLGCGRYDDEEFRDAFVNHLEETKKEFADLLLN